MNAIEMGAKQAVEKCLRVKSGEKMVVVTDRATESLGDAIVGAAKNVGAEVQKFVMEDFGERTKDGKNPMQLPEEIKTAMQSTNVSCYIAQKEAGELATFRQPLTNIVTDLKIRHAHMPGFNEVMMSQGMAADYDEIQKLSKKVYDLVSQAKEIRVTTPAGTDLTAKFDQKYKWVISDGNIQADNWSNLPDGEVFTAPVSADGVVMVDGVFGDMSTSKDVDLRECPLKYELKGGRCVKGSVECANEALKKEFEEYTFNTDEGSDRLGEFAIGTNIQLTEIIGILLQDEKFPGIHLALGNPYPDKTGMEYSSKAHNDGVLRDPTIIVDGKKIMENGKFLI